MKKRIVFISILLTFLVISSFVAMTKLFNRKTPVINYDSGDEVTQKIENINENELIKIENNYLIYFYPYSNLENISNQAIMKAVILNSDLYNKDSFTKDELDKALDNSPLKQLSIKHEDFWFNGYNSDDMPTYSYDAIKEVYTRNPTGKGACLVSRVDSKLRDFKEENDSYIISYQYIFYYGCEGDGIDMVYGSYEDAKNKKNPVFKITLTNNEDILSLVKSKFQIEYEMIQNKLDTYTYTFTKEGSNYILTNFNRENKIDT